MEIGSCKLLTFFFCHAWFSGIGEKKQNSGDVASNTATSEETQGKKRKVEDKAAQGFDFYLFLL